MTMNRKYVPQRTETENARYAAQMLGAGAFSDVAKYAGLVMGLYSALERNVTSAVIYGALFVVGSGISRAVGYELGNLSNYRYVNRAVFRLEETLGEKK